MSWKPQSLPYPQELESIKVLKLLPEADRALAELKNVAQSIPHQLFRGRPSQ